MHRGREPGGRAPTAGAGAACWLWGRRRAPGEGGRSLVTDWARGHMHRSEVSRVRSTVGFHHVLGGSTERTTNKLGAADELMPPRPPVPRPVVTRQLQPARYAPSPIPVSCTELPPPSPRLCASCSWTSFEHFLCRRVAGWWVVACGLPTERGGWNS